MNAGNMTDLIGIYGYTKTTGATGATEQTETFFMNLWADPKPVRGREGQDAGRLASIQTYLVKIHYRDDITTENFIMVGQKKLNIRTVTDRWREEGYRPDMFLTLECEDGVQT